MRGSALSLSLFALSARLAAAQTFADHTLNIVNAQISPDGFSRKASLVNGKFPGTTIIANKGDIIRNTVHWHGLFQTNYCIEDGPAFVTQCPISPGYSYQYVIPTFNQAGTHWYHSHLGSQYVDGVRGAVVIYGASNDPTRAMSTTNPPLSNSQTGINQLQLSQKRIKSGKEPIPDAGLINGRGRYVGGPAVPWTVFNVEKGKRYRFRVINTNALGYYKFEMDGHPFTIIEADGVAHQPLTSSHLSYTPESVIPSSFMRIRRSGTTGSGHRSIPVVVEFVGLRSYAVSTDELKDISFLIVDFSGNTLNVAQLRPLENPGAPGGSRPADVVIDLKYGASLEQDRVANFTRSENTIVLPHNKVIELVLHGSANGFEHPWHLHGHAFDVVQTDGGPVNYVNPPRKDVIAVGGGTVRIQFRSDNPGPWFLHCHVDWHLEAGLAVVFAEAPSEQRATIQPSPGWSQLCPRYAALPADKQ
ncbi:Multicopper oxidase [Ceratobasidium sp. AG-Ba]|nr:Multicopper oxidase [Ceratobasidium sp. AG-Ba]